MKTFKTSTRFIIFMAIACVVILPAGNAFAYSVSATQGRSSGAPTALSDLTAGNTIKATGVSGTYSYWKPEAEVAIPCATGMPTQCILCTSDDGGGCCRNGINNGFLTGGFYTSGGGLISENIITDFESSNGVTVPSGASTLKFYFPDDDQHDNRGSCSLSLSNTSSCTSHASKKCVGNSVYWFNSCGTQEDLFQACSGVCSNGSCVNITCSSNSDCGSSGYTGSPFCQSGNVYKNYTTYTCNNAGTANSTCSNSTSAKLVTTCGTNQTCSNGICINEQITCSSNSDCGDSAYTGSPFCSGNSVYQNYTTYTCNNAGTSTSYCSNNTASKLKKACSTNQACANGSCSDQDITCSSTSDCGTNGYTGSAYCQGNNVYQNYTTYACNNAGTSTSYCSNSTASKLKTNCNTNQTCSNGSCSDQNITCSSNSDCGSNAYTGSPFCSGNSVYQNYITYVCNNAGSSNSYCSNSTASQLKYTCSGSQACSNGSCGTNCTYHSYQQCIGNYLYWYDSCGTQQDSQYCSNGCSGNSCSNNNSYVTVQTNSSTNTGNNQATLNGYLYNSGNYYGNSCNTYVWFQYGYSTSYGLETSHQSQNYSGSFSQTVYNINPGSTYHYRAVAQGCSGNIVYGQDSTTYSQGTNSTLTVSKTVKNLTTGSGFASSVYASPSDTLMFMITLQPSGNQDLTSVYIRESLPANLIYQNQLTVSGSNNNYSGDIISGMNLNTISAGQTVTITYQVQVASAQNFGYGTTTLTSNTSVTGSSLNYNPNSSASVIVTRSGVLGASSISTGLTNNFWVDSFFLPLSITIFLLWMWKTGMFFGIERWFDSKKKTKKGYFADKELAHRIAQIKQTERI